jgi:hypothetical protein
MYLSSIEQDKVQFKNYSNNQVLEIFEKIGYDYKYDRRENFFGLQESLDDYVFIFNISLRVGRVEFIWAIRENGNILPFGGPWNFIIKMLGRGDLNMRKPVFSNYEDLESLLREGFAIYEDFKKEVVQSN